MLFFSGHTVGRATGTYYIPCSVNVALPTEDSEGSLWVGWLHTSRDTHCLSTTQSQQQPLSPHQTHARIHAITSQVSPQVAICPLHGFSFVCLIGPPFPPRKCLPVPGLRNSKTIFLLNIGVFCYKVGLCLRSSPKEEKQGLPSCHTGWLL